MFAWYQVKRYFRRSKKVTFSISGLRIRCRVEIRKNLLVLKPVITLPGFLDTITLARKDLPETLWLEFDPGDLIISQVEGILTVYHKKGYWQLTVQDVYPALKNDYRKITQPTKKVEVHETATLPVLALALT